MNELVWSKRILKVLKSFLESSSLLSDPTAWPLPGLNLSNTASPYRHVLLGPPTWDPAHPLECVPRNSSVNHLIAGCEFNARHLSKYTNMGSRWRRITWGDKGCALPPVPLSLWSPRTVEPYSSEYQPIINVRRPCRGCADDTQLNHSQEGREQESAAP